MTEIRKAMERVFSSLYLSAFVSVAQAASLTVDAHNKSGDELATSQAVVALHIPGTSLPGKARGAVHLIEQKDAQFTPFISAVQTGSSIKFPNLDSFAHHVYSFSEPAKFQSELYSQ